MEKPKIAGVFQKITNSLYHITQKTQEKMEFIYKKFTILGDVCSRPRFDF